MENLDAIKRDKTIKTDRLRYTKNTVPSLLIYLAIIMDIIYFILLYKENNEFFYTYFMGISVITNLVFLLASFLASEGIKNYKKEYSIVMVVLGIIQIARIFIYPTKAYKQDVVIDEVIVGQVLDTINYIKCIVYLSISGASLIIGAIIGYLRTIRLENHLKQISK